ncbi:alanine--tRNA ligase [Candidatus Photodesmus blepharus]|uniref:alanine--tRNA ligase n=1 Tax=Candidatus Photodesmus blepharonis TaxID=1179155 RepID=UPI0005529A01|nr:alanine--tRNA ligase [Candidatus Photodesmus blepharus]
MYMSTNEIRDTFLNFFEDKGHTIVDSSSLIPHNDSTLLFTNSGMNQFKNYFLGLEKPPYVRAATAQRCLRAGGKHNDLENVGFTARHHTFFEMLGNFSFGDYFKEDAISYAWEFLTEILKLSKDRLLITTYQTDKETFKIWNKKIGIPKDRIICIGNKNNISYESDNFWQMGDTGPCGPCTEIFYDHGKHISGNRPGAPEENGDRFIEIWNNVFMQFNRCENGNIELLPKPSVDTGMGIERVSAIMQGVHSNYEIDIFQKLIKAIAETIDFNNFPNQSLHVIADHIRSCSFLIIDGVIPSNEGRGYLLRRIIRRAARHGNKLGAKSPFFYKLVQILSEVMGRAGEELKKQQQIIENILRTEEENFSYTLERGTIMLNNTIDNLNSNVLEGKTIFKLYDTYGFPVDLINDIAKERKLSIDEKGFKKAMEEQQKRARAANQFSVDYSSIIKIGENTTFCGYTTTKSNTFITAIFLEGEKVELLSANDKAIVILEKSPFYAESGGQCGDSGIIQSDSALFKVEDTQKLGNVVAHYGMTIRGELTQGNTVLAKVDVKRRDSVCLNHSATHLLHSALRIVLGGHVVQKGSLVKPSGLRFDFSHFSSITQSELKKVERIVNTQIRHSHDIQTDIMDIELAKKKGAIALFGEKYDKEVRVVSMGDFSKELCGGTHASNTGNIGLFKITSERSIASGIRRIEASTGEVALDIIDDKNCAFEKRILKSINEAKVLKKEIQQMKEKIALKESSNIVNKVKQISGANVLVATLEEIDKKSLHLIVNKIQNQIGNGIILLASVTDKKICLISSVTKDLFYKVKANELVDIVAPKIGGKGGGRSNVAQAEGIDVKALPEAMRFVQIWLKEHL